MSDQAVHTNIDLATNPLRNWRDMFGVSKTSAGQNVLDMASPANIFTAGFDWWRLMMVADTYRGLNITGPVLDYATSDAELSRMLPEISEYHFTAANEIATATITGAATGASRNLQRTSLDRLRPEQYSAIFAIDRLVQSEHFAAEIAMLFASLKPGGYLILTGSTGIVPKDVFRWIVGLTHYKPVTSIYDVEYVVKAHGIEVCGRDVPGYALPLSRNSVWQKRCPERISTPPV